MVQWPGSCLVVSWSLNLKATVSILLLPVLLCKIWSLFFLFCDVNGYHIVGWYVRLLTKLAVASEQTCNIATNWKNPTFYSATFSNNLIRRRNGTKSWWMSYTYQSEWEFITLFELKFLNHDQWIQIRTIFFFFLFESLIFSRIIIFLDLDICCNADDV